MTYDELQYLLLVSQTGRFDLIGAVLFCVGFLFLDICFMERLLSPLRSELLQYSWTTTHTPWWRGYVLLWADLAR